MSELFRKHFAFFLYVCRHITSPSLRTASCGKCGTLRNCNACIAVPGGCTDLYTLIDGRVKKVYPDELKRNKGLKKIVRTCSDQSATRCDACVNIRKREDAKCAVCFDEPLTDESGKITMRCFVCKPNLSTAYAGRALALVAEMLEPLTEEMCDDLESLRHVRNLCAFSESIVKTKLYPVVRTHHVGEELKFDEDKLAVALESAEILGQIVKTYRASAPRKTRKRSKPSDSEE